MITQLWFGFVLIITVLDDNPGTVIKVGDRIVANYNWLCHEQAESAHSLYSREYRNPIHIIKQLWRNHAQDRRKSHAA